MTFEQIHYLIEISRSGSFSAAAEKLYLTQPYLSSIVRKLEIELGIQIFKRGRKGAELTADGKDLLACVQPLYERQKYILNLYNSKKRKPVTRFVFSTQRYPFVIKVFLETFQASHADDFAIEIRETNMYKVIEEVGNHQSELGIIFLSPATEIFLKRYLSAKGVVFHPICQVYPRIFFRKVHPLAKLKAVSLEQASQYPFASFTAEDYIAMDFSEEILLPSFHAAEKRYKVIDRGTMINILTNTDAFSIGTGILPHGYAGPELTSRPLEGDIKPIKICWIAANDYQPSSLGTSFIKELKKALNKTSN